MQKATSPLFLIVFAAMLAACASAAATEVRTPDNQPPEGVTPDTPRLAAPASSACDRNQLTSWFGAVSGYRRERETMWLEVSTDYATVEQIDLEYGNQVAAPAQFQLRGQTFTDADWALIERSPGVLKEGMRVVVWICEDGQTAPLVDWQPADE